MRYVQFLASSCLLLLLTLLTGTSIIAIVVEQNAVRSVTTAYAAAISNPWNTTVMPVEFRWKLVGIMAGNLVVLCLW